MNMGKRKVLIVSECYKNDNNMIKSAKTCESHQATTKKELI